MRSIFGLMDYLQWTRGTDSKLCCAVIIGVNERGGRTLSGYEDGVSAASSKAWRDVDCFGLRTDGLNAPKLAVGDGARVSGQRLDEVYGETVQQRCWMHKNGQRS